MLTEPPYRNIPKVPLDRRAYAFLIDYVTVWLLTSLLGGNNFFVQFLIFVVAWLVLRVFLVVNNHGQSLGRWALDMKLLDIRFLDPRFMRVPTTLSLAKREGILGFAAFIAMVGLNLTFINPFSTLMLVCPLLADCGFVLADQDWNQAFHDRLGQTVIVPTRRGFSLDIRLRRLYWEVKKTLRKK